MNTRPILLCFLRTIATSLCVFVLGVASFEVRAVDQPRLPTLPGQFGKKLEKEKLFRPRQFMEMEKLVSKPVLSLRFSATRRDQYLGRQEFKLPSDSDYWKPWYADGDVVIVENMGALNRSRPLRPIARLKVRVGIGGEGRQLMLQRVLYERRPVNVYGDRRNASHRILAAPVQVMLPFVGNGLRRSSSSTSQPMIYNTSLGQTVCFQVDLEKLPGVDINIGRSRLMQCGEPIGTLEIWTNMGRRRERMEVLIDSKGIVRDQPYRLRMYRRRGDGEIFLLGDYEFRFDRARLTRRFYSWRTNFRSGDTYWAEIVDGAGREIARSSSATLR